MKKNEADCVHCPCGAGLAIAYVRMKVGRMVTGVKCTECGVTAHAKDIRAESMSGIKATLNARINGDAKSDGQACKSRGND